MPERADTLEVIDLIIFAPLLYSMFIIEFAALTPQEQKKNNRFWRIDHHPNRADRATQSRRELYRQNPPPERWLEIVRCSRICIHPQSGIYEFAFICSQVFRRLI